MFWLFFNLLLGLFCEIGMLIYLGILFGYGVLLVLYFLVWLEIVNVKLWFINDFYSIVMWVKFGFKLLMFCDVFMNIVLLIVFVFLSGSDGFVVEVSCGFSLFWKEGGRKCVNVVLVEFFVWRRYEEIILSKIFFYFW